MSGARPPLANTSPSREPSADAAGAGAGTIGVISGGTALTEAERFAVSSIDCVIAADSGLDLATEAGIAVDVAIGDFDSVSPDGLRAASETGVEIMRFEADKDETDLELALLRATELGADRIVVVGLAGGRPDHALSSLLLLADQRWSAADVVGHVGDSVVSIVRGGSNGGSHVFADAAIGDLISLVPVGGDAHGVTTTGLRWPLVDETLAAHSPRGMSNIVDAPDACVRVAAGTLLAFERPADGQPTDENR